MWLYPIGIITYMCTAATLKKSKIIMSHHVSASTYFLMKTPSLTQHLLLSPFHVPPTHLAEFDSIFHLQCLHFVLDPAMPFISPDNVDLTNQVNGDNYCKGPRLHGVTFLHNMVLLLRDCYQVIVCIFKGYWTLRDFYLIFTNIFIGLLFMPVLSNLRFKTFLCPFLKYLKSILWFRSTVCCFFFFKICACP